MTSREQNRAALQILACDHPHTWHKKVGENVKEICNSCYYVLQEQVKCPHFCRPPKPATRVILSVWCDECYNEGHNPHDDDYDTAARVYLEALGGSL